jgi:hypothetical protein
VHTENIDDIEDIGIGLWLCRRCLDCLEGPIPESSLCPSCSHPDEPTPTTSTRRRYELSPDGQTAHWIAAGAADNR